MFYIKRSSKKFQKNSQENNCARVSFLIKFIKKRLWHKCFPVNYAKSLRTPFLQNTHKRLLLPLKTQAQLFIHNKADGETPKVEKRLLSAKRTHFSITARVYPVDTGRKLNVLCTFNLRPVSVE